MEDAFSNAADLLQIDGTKNLKVSDVVHQAFVEVRMYKYNRSNSRKKPEDFHGF